MTDLICAGLEANNPLGLFAALGLLRVLDRDAAAAERARPRLGFVDQGSFVARLVTPCTKDDVIAAVLRNATAQADNLALQFAYSKDGAPITPTTSGAIRDLKPSPDGARALLDGAATADRWIADQAAAWFSELIQDNNDRTKPTAFHFTAGQQAFLAMVEDLRAGLTADHLREALDGPWLNTAQLPSLSWDASVARQYALRAGNPPRRSAAASRAPTGSPSSDWPSSRWSSAASASSPPPCAAAGKTPCSPGRCGRLPPRPPPSPRCCASTHPVDPARARCLRHRHCVLQSSPALRSGRLRFVQPRRGRPSRGYRSRGERAGRDSAARPAARSASHSPKR